MTHADFYEYGLPIQSPYYPGDIVTPDLPPQYLVFKPCLLSDLYSSATGHFGKYIIYSYWVALIR